MSLKEGKIVYVTSVRGGVGKTNFLLNLAGTYSNMKKKTLIIDLDLYSNAISFLLNLENKKDLFSVTDEINNNAYSTIDDYIYKYNDYISVLSAPKDPRNANKINTKYIDMIISKVRGMYDVILIDSNYFLNELNLNMMDQSDIILYIINNEPLCIKNMKNIIAIYGNMKKTNYKIILNNSNNKNNNYYTSCDINFMLGKVVDYIIPSNLFNKNINKEIIKGNIRTLQKNSKIYEKISENILKG